MVHLTFFVNIICNRPATLMHPSLSIMLVFMILCGVQHAHRRSEFSYYACSVRDVWIAPQGGWVDGLPTQVTSTQLSSSLIQSMYPLFQTFKVSYEFSLNKPRAPASMSFDYMAGNPVAVLLYFASRLYSSSHRTYASTQFQRVVGTSPLCVC